MKNLLLTSSILLITFAVSAQCTISSTKSDLCIGDAVSFSITSTKSISSVLWDFDNGQTSNSNSPLASFNSAGQYSITCQVTFGDGSSCSAQSNILVHEFPNAQIEIDSKSIHCRDINSICLNDLSTTSSGNKIVKRHYYWGDGSNDFNSTNTTLCHHYSITNNSIELGVEAFDSFGCSDTAFTTIYFDPIVSTSLAVEKVSETCENGEYCIIVKNSPETIVKRTSWEKDGVAIFPIEKDCFSASTNFSHSYKVKVENNYGCFSYDSLTLTRTYQEASGPAFLLEDTICYGTTLDLIIEHPVITNDSFHLFIKEVASDSILIDTIFQPIPGDDKVFFQIYPELVGKHEIRVRSLNAIRIDCKLDQLIYAHVKGPKARDRISNQAQCIPQDTVFLNDSSDYYLNSSSLGYYWSFGDSYSDNSKDYNPYHPYQFNGYSTLKNTKHFYQKISCFAGYLTVTDSINGCTNSKQFVVSTSSVGRFTLSLLDPKSLYCENDSILFDINGIGDNYQEIDPSHIDLNRCPVASIISPNTKYTWQEGYHTSTTNLYCEKEEVTVKSYSNEKYYFANGSQDTTFVSDSVCSIETTHEEFLTIDNNPTIDSINLDVSTLSCEKINLNFQILTEDSIKTMKIKWTDSLRQESDSLEYFYDKLMLLDTTLNLQLDTGIFIIEVTFYSDCECERTWDTLVSGGLRIKPKINGICAGSHFDVEYDAEYIQRKHFFNGTNYPESYNWRFDTLGWTRNLDTMVPYDTSGAYKLELAYTDWSGNCVDTISVIVPVKKVFADFSSTNDQNYCKKLIEFYDESIVKDSGEIVKWHWDLANKTTSTERNPAKLFKKKGNYTIELIAESKEGCLDTITKTIKLDGPNPLYAILSDTIGCDPMNVDFVNRSTNAKRFLWEWNDIANRISDTDLDDDTLISWKFQSPGIYFPKLTAYDTVYTRNNYYVCSEFFPDTNYNHIRPSVEIVDSIELIFDLDDVACTGELLEIITHQQYDHLDFVYVTDRTTDTFNIRSKDYYLVSQKDGTITFKFFAKTVADSKIPNCSDTFTKTIPIQNPDVDFSYCISNSDKRWSTIKTSNKSTDISKYLWRSNGTISNPNIMEPYVSFDQSTETNYLCLEVVSKGGCIADTCIDVYLPVLKLFNVFTPEGDNLNQYFDLVTENLTSYNLEIYNRYGELVFKSNADGIGDSPHNWNGRYMNEGKLLPEGTYFYIFKYSIEQCQSSEIQVIEGTVDLIR